ncbi:ATP-binding protein [Gorillibacterium sp. sgz5001074]|uniref:ATP-binding protein n=1 Tax=Gorillibacterium sp. sgz5001074 TaxID=3446695 RepID=UPI003F67F95C
MTNRSIPLTEHISVTSGSHILYFYDELQAYVDNAVSFIVTGFEQGQHVIFIDSPERYVRVIERLKDSGYGERLNRVEFILSDAFYLLSETFYFDKVFENFVNAVQPYLEQRIPVRAWGHVMFEDQEDLTERLHQYECKCDLAINQLGVLTVCAYSGRHVSASLLARMLKSHEYLMTDEDLVRSNLYRKPGMSVIFPSLSEHAKIVSERDLYKQKLDFVHVVSHEVRNPLTVIKAYATMLRREAEEGRIGESAAKRLAEIQDYVSVIDHEMTHIINTEQMLTTEALWRKSAVGPERVLREVAEMMEIKARTQGIGLTARIGLTGKEVMHSNIIGLRLVVSNLLSNAVKYSHEGSVVELEAEVSGGELHLTVRDYGIGISGEQQEQLFRKYQKMNTEQNGQGIGLFMVKKLVDHFEGVIELDSEVGEGTTFRLRFPVLPG